ncbi:MAG: hypothetical protein ABI563_16825 [Specibacter sp.]
MAAVRISVGVLGAAGAAYGIYSLLTHLTPAALLGLAAWLAVALLLHDGVLVPLVTATGHGLRHVGRNLRPLSCHVIRGSLVLGSVFTLVVAPLMTAQQVAGDPSINSTALQGDYALALGILWSVLVAVAALSVAGVERYPRRVNRQINRS